MKLTQWGQLLFHSFGYHVERVGISQKFPIIKPMDKNGVEILADKEFRDSCKAVIHRTLLDTPRLANLWMLCRMTDAEGAMVEIGSYKGGGALHLSNCCPKRKIMVFDPFDRASFEHISPSMDNIFRKGQFSDSSEDDVARLLQGRNKFICRGYFPSSVRGTSLPTISFVHLDVDVYAATKDSLTYLLTEAKLAARTLIVLDDYNRGAAGVNTAVEEILCEIKGTLAFPLFPGQALIIPKSWYSSNVI